MKPLEPKGSLQKIKYGIFHRDVLFLNSTLNSGIPPVLLFQLEVYCEVDRLLTGLTSQQKGTPAQWYSNKTSLDPKNPIFNSGHRE